jgi:molybdopterin-guanine dinucleotide biosynthesis protein A
MGEQTMADDLRPVAVVLAGGKAQRMGGGDKGLLWLRRRPLLDHVLDRVRPQVRAIALNANGDPRRFAQYGLPLLADPVPGQPGPLAGVLAGLRWARTMRPAAPLLLTVPTDTPLLPDDLVRRLMQARTASGAAVACAASRGQRHPVVALWSVDLAENLAAALAAGERGVAEWAEGQGLVVVDFTTEAPPDAPDPFLNVNDRADLARAARQMG